MDNQDPMGTAPANPSEDPATPMPESTASDSGVATPPEGASSESTVAEQPMAEPPVAETTTMPAADTQVASANEPTAESAAMPTEPVVTPTETSPVAEPTVEQDPSTVSEPTSYTAPESQVAPEMPAANGEASEEPAATDNDPAAAPMPMDSNPAAAASEDSSSSAVDIPDSWPGAFKEFKHVKPAAKKIFWLVFLIGLVEIVINVGFNLFTNSLSKSSPGKASNIAMVIGLQILIITLINALFTGSAISLYYAGLRDTTISLGLALKTGLNKLVKIFVASIIVGILVYVSFFLFIIPFFFVAPRLVMAPYLIVGEDAGVLDAISRSWRITKGSVGKVYGLAGLQILIGLLALTIIGLPFAIYWGVRSLTTTAQLCRYLVSKEGAPTMPVSPTPEQTPSEPVAPASPEAVA